MKDAKSLLDSLMGTVNSATQQVTGGQGIGGLAEQAKGAWAGQSPLAKGAIAGGLLSLLLTKGGRRVLGSGAQIGGAALIGGLAYKAWSDWKAGKAAQVETASAAGGPVALPQPDATFLPTDLAAADDLSARLLQAMVAAAKADGHVTPEERARIDAALPQLGLGAEATAMIAAELDAPLDAGRVAGLARTEEEAAEVYAASLLVVDPEAPAEKGYLAMLAARLKLDPGLVAHLHARAASLG